ncbi:tRNA dihydrouridine synthase DusB [Hylemonella sp. W303a]|uniref:tRNA dihydrouridine synthase DusB n=1 Tax=Hylemonella sp. W303a TaxID=3389873 RepID=UPI00396B0E16
MNPGLVSGVRIGAHLLPNNVFAAPMAGVTDRPFRKLCKALGAGYAVSEMVTSRKELWNSLKTSRRADHSGEPGPIAVQIAGTDAAMMAEAAVYNIERGAQIIDINMGCPAKKVCNKWAGSALMQDEALALEIAEAVVAACEPHAVPVTLKMRTGWCQSNKNAVTLARAFEGAGIRMLTVHGRTREQGYGGEAEYDTIAAVKAAVQVPVVANGDITSPEKARAVLVHTGADAVMIGRAAQGRPWIFREVAHYLSTGEHLAPPLVAEVKRLLLDHLQEHYLLYGDDRWSASLAAGPETLSAASTASTGVQPGTNTGVRSARKHIGWYVRGLPGGEAFRAHMNGLEDSRAQWQAVSDYFDELGAVMDRLPAADAVLPGPVEVDASV